MTDFPCPAEVVDLLLLGKRLPEGTRTLPEDLRHPITDDLEDSDELDAD